MNLRLLYDSRMGYSAGSDGIFNDGTMNVTNSTFSRNSAGSGGGIFGSTYGTVTARNVIVAVNTAASSPDIAGQVNSQGHNLIGDSTGGSGYDPTDLVGTGQNPIDPMLGPLADNGGPTQTIALLPGSPALNAGDPTSWTCPTSGASCAAVAL